MNAPSLETGRLLPRLFCSTRPVPESPLTVPPTVKALVEQVTATLVTFALPTVPEPFVTEQVWLGPVGCVSTLTA